jgi:hypothetical protein
LTRSEVYQSCGEVLGSELIEYLEQDGPDDVSGLCIGEVVQLVDEFYSQFIPPLTDDLGRPIVDPPPYASEGLRFGCFPVAIAFVHWYEWKPCPYEAAYTGSITLLLLERP